MNSLPYSTFGKGVMPFLIVSMSLCSTSVISAADIVDQQEGAPEASVTSVADLVDQQKSVPETTEVPVVESVAKEEASSESSGEAVETVLTEQKKEKVDSREKTDSLEEPFVADDPSVTVESDTDGMTYLYIGGAIGVVAIGIAALAGGGGSSSDSSETLPDSVTPSTPLTPTTAPIGPDLNGGDWGGYLSIKDTAHAGFQNVAANIVHSGTSVQITTTSTLDYGRQFSGTITSSGHMLVYDATTGQDWTTNFGNARTDSVDLYDYVNDFRDLDKLHLAR